MARALRGLGRVHAAGGVGAAALREFARSRRMAEEIHDHPLVRESEADVAALPRR
ncbi:hypothetical protein ACN20G_33065 (plasmid) [Streptomyces sp. BI20]|uniref:hypothetical protein n=1 Tax=Streptomyces sp. BI20 TaxID=3403460 RepID=UPI003C753AF3